MLFRSSPHACISASHHAAESLTAAAYAGSHEIDGISSQTRSRSRISSRAEATWGSRCSDSMRASVAATPVTIGTHATRRRLTVDTNGIVERLRSIEEELRDLAYDRLREAAGGDEAARADEKRVLQARRAVEKAIRVLDGPGEQYD